MRTQLATACGLPQCVDFLRIALGDETVRSHMCSPLNSERQLKRIPTPTMQITLARYRDT